VRKLLLVAALVAALAPAPAGAAVIGEQRLLVALVTWGPQPFSADDARRVLANASAYERGASYGKVWLSGDVTAWLSISRPAQCDTDALDRAARAAATAAGFDPGRYTRLVFAFPQIDCPWGGAYYGLNVWANGYFVDELLEHELGHIFGTPEEGPAWLCDASGCHVTNYASPYSVMGHGVGQYSAYEKFAYGWLRPTSARGSESYTLDALERNPSALRVLTADDEYWFEFRADDPGWNSAPWLNQFDFRPTAGVVVHAGPNGLTDGVSVFPSRDLYVPANGKAALQLGEAFEVRGAFRLTLSSVAGDRATVALRWTDKTRPRAPAILQAKRSVRWRASVDSGSGVASYAVSVDGKALETVAAVQDLGSLLVPTNLELALPRLPRGPHRVAIVAVDRAGNRSKAATRSFRLS
jgi:hypothetical protein